jgi:hypothetical protein
VAQWLFYFKYWTTAYELRYLFILENIEKIIKRRKMFFVMNIVVILLQTVPLIVFDIVYAKTRRFSVTCMVLLMISAFAQIGVIVDGCIRMNRIIS